MNLRKFISLLVVSILVCVSSIFADHIGRNVYSIYSDNFNGVGIENTAAGTDFVNFWAGGSGTHSDNYNEKIEGKKSFEMGSDSWISIDFGSNRKDITSNYEKICFSLKFPSDCSTSKAYIKINDGLSGDAGCPLVFSDSKIKRVDNGSNVLGTGILADGNWHNYYIYLSDFPVKSTETIKCPLIISTDKNLGGRFFIDNVYYLKKSAGAKFSIKVKNVSDNSEVVDKSKPITFSSDKFRTGLWDVANQYLEMDMDGEMKQNNWVIRVYTNDNSKKGLYNGDSVLPMAWRVSISSLPYVYIDDQSRENINSLEIGENWSEDGKTLFGLYDKGKDDKVGGAKTWYPWFFMQTKGDTSEDSSVWNNEGYHSFVNTDEDEKKTQYYDSPANYYERKPKLYLALNNTTDAFAVKYTGAIIINLSYE